MIDLEHVSKDKSAYNFYLNKLIKQSRPGKEQPVLVLPAFPADRRLCVVTYLEAYIARTETLQKTNTKLFLSFTKPHHPVTSSTISRWAKTVMYKSGIGVNKFKPNSTRSSSTSAAYHKGVPLDIIMKSAGWSSECTFASYYKREVQSETEYGYSILSCGL